MRYSVCNVGKAFRQNLVKIVEDALLDYFGMKGGNAVYAVRTDDAKICHAYLAVAYYAHIFKFIRGHVFVFAFKARVYFAYYLVNARQAYLKQVFAPLFQRLAHYRMVCIGDGVYRHVPRAFPRISVFVHQQTH